jgi:hypothetical protein
MNTFFDSVRKHSRLWLWSAIALTVLTGFLVTRSGRCLKTGSAPLAIVSLELAWKPADATAIRNEWTNTFCSDGNIVSDAVVVLPDVVTVSHMAKKNIVDDFWFLMAYTLLFMVCVARVDPFRLPGQPVSRRTKLFVAFALMAGVLDSLENFFMWKFLETHDVPNYTFAFPATFKFILVFSLIAYILFSLLKKVRLRR